MLRDRYARRDRISILGYSDRVTMIDDIYEGIMLLNARLEATGKAVADWAASDRGQEILAGVDYLAVSSQIADFYRHTGWYFPMHPELHRYALEHLEFSIPFDARDAARRVGPSSKHWDWIVAGTLASPSIAGRKAIVEDAFFCLEHGRWSSAVSTLLPVIEGIVSDRSGVLAGIRVGERAHRILDSAGGPLEGISAVPALELLDTEIFESRPFGAVSLADQALNRHIVLHGRSSSFGTEVNACRILMILIALAEILDGLIILRTDTAPTEERSYLDDYGPLAGLRAAARRQSRIEAPAAS
jgi:hypothetical protein